MSSAVEPLIDGVSSPSQNDARIEAINPSNGQRCLSIPAGCEADVARAVASARRAFEQGAWSQAAPSHKKTVLHRLADLIERDAGDLDAFDAEEMGKPVGEKFCNAAGAASYVRFFAEAVDKVSGEVFSSDRDSFVAQRRVPRGVVAALVPWNFPTFNTAMKIAPALAAGNCVVLKPSELSSRSAIRIGQLALEAQLAPGTLNVLPGLGNVVGRALALHGDVDMVAFTGSTSVGKLMLQYAGLSNMKAVLAECGGKSPQIVFDDGVDLDAVSESIARSILTNQGQVCSAGSRVLVQRSIEGVMLEKISASVRRIVIGDALDSRTTFGPLASAAQLQRVMRYIESAEADGAQLLAGGRKLRADTGGYFLEPTIFRITRPDVRIAQEEIFGPILSVIPFEDEADAIRVANGTIYGLIAYVWTASLSTGMRMVKGIRSSVVINAGAPRGEGAGFAASFEPAGQSGAGIEGGLVGMESYLRRQSVWFNHG